MVDGLPESGRPSADRAPTFCAVQGHSRLGVVRVGAGPAENFDIFDFELAGDDIAAIDALDTGRRAGADPDRVDTKLFSWKAQD